MPARLLPALAALLLSLAAYACDDEPTPPTPAAEPPPPAPAAEPAPQAPPDPHEACARVLVVAYRGAAHAPDSVQRSATEARVRATGLLARLHAGEDFATLARAESDAASSGPRGGLLGTYQRDEWPSIHAPLRDPLFALPVGALSDLIEAPYGFVIARRCPVEKVHTRHLLIRFQGARAAGQEITRSEEEALALATRLHTQALTDGADLDTLAREHSEDASAERGGDIGPQGRGRLAPEYEEAAFSLQPGEISPIIRTDFGFHIIQRLE